MQKLLALEEDYIKRLKTFGKFTDADSFFNNYVLLGDVTGINTLKADLIANDPSINQDVVDGIITRLTIDGLLSLGGKDISKGKMLTGISGNKHGQVVLRTPEKIIEALDTPEVKLVLGEIMSPDHVDELQDIMVYLNNVAKSNDLENTVTVAGLVRAIGMNEMISRAFNIARGMVSPAYVGAEFAVRISQTAGIDMLKLAANDPTAATIFRDCFLYPERMDRARVRELSLLMVDFMVTELARMDVRELPVFNSEIIFDEGL